MREFTVANNSFKVKDLARLRQEWEAYFALTVYNVFNQGEPLRKLQWVAHGLLSLLTDPRSYKAWSNDALRNKAFNSVDRFWRRFDRPTSVQAAHRLMGLSGQFDATDCADVMRVVGTWVEEGGLPNLMDGLTADAMRRIYRAGDTDEPEAKEAWGPGARPPRAMGHFPIAPHIEKHMPVMSHANVGTAAPGRATSTGMTARRAADTSVVKALDRLFDLTVGVEISGTTADVTFDLELINNLLLSSNPKEQLSVSAARMMHVGYYLIPVGTIVANMHHTLLEVALTLTFEQLIDYRAGFFKTLTPRRLTAWPPELAAIEHAMDNADAKMIQQGLHYFCYHNAQGAKEGIFQLEAEEVPAWKASTMSGARVLHRWARTHHYPSRQDVRDLLRLAGLQVPR